MSKSMNSIFEDPESFKIVKKVRSDCDDLVSAKSGRNHYGKLNTIVQIMLSFACYHIFCVSMTFRRR